MDSANVLTIRRALTPLRPGSSHTGWSQYLRLAVEHPQREKESRPQALARL